MSGRRILFAITSHGLGHLTRSLAIADALHELDPGIELVVATEHPEARISLDLPAPFQHRRVGYEPGTLQRSCFELDRPGTLAAYREFLDERQGRLDAEREFLRAIECEGVVADIPALPVRAAGDLGLPVIGVGNFTWDWILAPLVADSPLEDLPQRLASDYAGGRCQLRLPFGPDSSPFPSSEPAPLVSRRASLEPMQLRDRLGLPKREDRALVVVCPGGWHPEGWTPIHVAGCAGYRFVTVGDLPITADAPLLGLPHALPEGVGFPDLVAAADLVLAKPGYGIASECVTHRSALVSIERPDFRETPLLLEDFAEMGPSSEISLEDFFVGRWEAALDRARESQTPWRPVPEDGARAVAERIAELMEE